jgi:hypothetical protein
MTIEKNKPTKPFEDNTGLIRQLLNDARSECYRGCAVNITTLSESGNEQEIIGSVDRIDLSKETIYINEALAIEGVSLDKIIGYRWQ